MEKTYGPSLLVAAGWFVMPVAAFAVGQWSLPDAPEPADLDCTSVGCGWTWLDILPAVVIVAGVPLLLVLMVVTAAMTRLRVPAAAAGALSALATALIVAVGVALVMAAV